MTEAGSEPIHIVKAEFFRVLGHPVRVRILELLRDGERAVGDLQAALEINSSGTSQHLGALRRQGILESRREGTSVFYRVQGPANLPAARGRPPDPLQSLRGRTGVARRACRSRRRFVSAAEALALGRRRSSRGGDRRDGRPQGVVGCAPLVQAAGMALIGAAGLAVLIDGEPLGAAFSGGIEPSLRDRPAERVLPPDHSPSSPCPALVYARGYLPAAPRPRVLLALTGAFLAALVGVVVARDPSTFLAFWELITLVPAIAILVLRSDAAVRGAVFVYLAVTHLGGVGRLGQRSSPWPTTGRSTTRAPWRCRDRDRGARDRRRDRRLRDQGRADAPAFLAARAPIPSRPRTSRR